MCSCVWEHHETAALSDKSSTRHAGVQADVVAGMTIGVMVVPQAISYSNLAGLPARYGLHAAFVPVFIYAIWGSSRQLVGSPA